MAEENHNIAEMVFVEAEDAKGSTYPSLTGRISYREIGDVISEMEMNGLEGALRVPQRHTAYPDTHHNITYSDRSKTISITDTPLLKTDGNGLIDDACVWGVTILIVRSASTDERARKVHIYSPLILEIARRYREALRSENMISSLYYPNEPQQFP